MRVEGRVARMPAEESETYFRTRPLGSRLHDRIRYELGAAGWARLRLAP